MGKNNKPVLVANIQVAQPIISPDHAEIMTEIGDDLLKELEKQSKAVPTKTIAMSMNIDGRTPLLEVKRRYIAYKHGQGLSPATIKGVESMFSTLYKFLSSLAGKDCGSKATQEEIDGFLAYVPLLVLEKDEFEGIYRMWLEKRYKKTSVWEEMVKFSAFYRYCSEVLGAVKKKDLKIKPVNPPTKPLFSDEQIITLLQKPKDLARNYTEYRDWMIVLYALNTGNRRRSIVNIQMKDLDMLNDGYVRIQETKSGKPQIVYTPDKVVKELRDFISMWRYDATETDYLFTDKYGNQLTPDNLGHIITRYMKKRLKDDCPASASIHLLRHQYSAFFIKNGGSMFDLQKQLGHSTLEMVKHYADHYGNPNGEIIERVSPINYYYKAINKTPIQSKKKK
jgi:integrase/recombinase XerD